MPVALTHGFKGALVVAAALAAVGFVAAVVLLPGRRRRVADEQAETVALASARCPGGPYSGHLARVAARAAER